MPDAGVYLPRTIMQRRVESYVPRAAGPGWDRVAQRVRGLVLRADPLVPYDAAELLSVLARLAMFCDDHGQTDSRVWLEPTTVEWFLAEGCAHLSGHTRATYRARLRRLAEAIDGTEHAAPVRLSASEASRPYGTAEQAALYSWASGQPTDALRHGTRLLLALGLGCGLASDEIIHLRTGQVRPIDNGAVVVEAGGRRSRLVICRYQWERLLATLAADAGTGYVFCPRAVRAKNLISNFLARAHYGPTAVPLRVSRLRASWLAEHLTAGLWPPTLLTAAGLDSLAGLDRVVPYLPSASAAQAHRQLRGR